MDNLVGRLSFRVQQLNVRVETKTLDNVFITAVVSVQYQILREKVYEAFYSLTNRKQKKNTTNKTWCAVLPPRGLTLSVRFFFSGPANHGARVRCHAFPVAESRTRLGL